MIITAIARSGHKGCLPVVLGLALFVIGCSPIALSLDYDPSADFTGYATYDWLDNRPGVPERVGNAAIQDPSFDKQVRQAVSNALVAKRLSEDQVAPDLLVTYYVGGQGKIDVENYGYRYAKQYGGWGGEIDVQHYREGTLVLDLIDAATMRLVWRGAAGATHDEKQTPEESQSRVNEAVGRLFGTYPPSR